MTEAEIMTQVKATAARVMGMEAEQIREEFHYMSDLGIDSLAMIQLKLELEDVFDLDIPDEHIFRVTTVGNTGKYLLERLQEQ